MTFWSGNSITEEVCVTWEDDVVMRVIWDSAMKADLV